MNSSEEKHSNSVDREEKDKSPQVNTENQSEPKPTMSKREIMEELSRQRFPWEE